MSRPNRRGSLANTVVWSLALLAIAGVTVWKFEIWPIAWEATQTGSLDETDPASDVLRAAPIEVATSAVEEHDPQVEPAAGTVDRAPRPAALPALDIGRALPTTPPRTTPQWPIEPGPLPHANNAKPLPGVSSSTALTGSDFAERSPHQPRVMPANTPRRLDEAPAEEPVEEVAPAEETEGSTPVIVPSSAEQPAAASGAIEPALGTEDMKAAADPRIAVVDEHLEGRRFLAAHKELSKLYWAEPSLRQAIASRIEMTSRSIYFDPQPHYMAAYEVAPGDQLRVFARQYNVPWEYLARLNRIDDASRIKAGQRIKVIKGPFGAVVDLNDFSLTVHAHGYFVRRYPVGVGADESTPMGTFRVVLKEADPKYYGPDLVMERDDPANPLGERWIGLDDGAGHPTSYGIHGTVDPDSIGKAESRGCVRLRNGDIEELYDLLGVGSEVVIQR